MNKYPIEKVIMNRSTTHRCPQCNSTAVRKREMIVKAGTYDRVGGSTGFFNRSPTRVFASTGRNRWAQELAPMSYFWPSVLALFLWAWAYGPDTTVGLGFYLFITINTLWFVGVYSDQVSFRKEWACSKCGEVWDPTESEDDSAEGSKVV